MNKRLKTSTQAMKVNESVVSRLIRGRRSLKTEEVKKWSRILNCDPSLLEERQ